jgi:ketosteroid isomerase-like protein
MSGPPPNASPEEFLREGYSYFNTLDRTASPDWFHEDAVYAASREDPDSATHVGREAVAAQFARWVEAYPDLTVEPLDVRAGTSERVFAWVRFSGSGAESGLPIAMELAVVWTLREGKIARIAEYSDRDEALAAAGLA